MRSWPVDGGDWGHEPAQLARRSSRHENLGKLHRGCRKGKGSEISGETCRVGKREMRVWINQNSSGHGGKWHASRRRAGEEKEVLEEGTRRREEESPLHGAAFQ